MKNDKDFDLNKLNRPSSGDEASTKSEADDNNVVAFNWVLPPCSGHDKMSELQLASDRLKLIKEQFNNTPRIFETGAKRDSNSEKPFIHCLKGYTRQRFGYHMTLGANKYGNSNWELGIPTEVYLESIDRHLASYMEGDRSEDHLSAILFGIQGCMINEQKQGINSDYYFNLKNKKLDK